MVEEEALNQVQQLRSKPFHRMEEADILRRKLMEIGAYDLNPATSSFCEKVIDAIGGRELNGYFLMMQLPTSAHLLRDGGFYEQGLVSNPYNDGKDLFNRDVNPWLRVNIDRFLEMLAPNPKVAEDAKLAKRIAMEKISSRGEASEDLFI